MNLKIYSPFGGWGDGLGVSAIICKLNLRDLRETFGFPMETFVILNLPAAGRRREESLGYDERYSMETRSYFARDSFRTRS